MRKVFLLFGLLAMVGILFVACTDEQATGPEETPEEAVEPDFNFQFPGCEQYFDALRPEGKARALFRVFDGQIIAVSLVRQVRRNARYGRWQRAATKAWQLAALVDRKLPNRLVDPCGSAGPTTEEGAAALMTEVFELAGVELPGGELPPEAFLPGGGYGQIDPAAGGIVLANNDEAALVADPGAFPAGSGPVTITFYRLPDPVFGVPDFPVFGYQNYAEAYNFTSTVDPREGGPGVEFWMCVVEPLPEPVDFADLVIGHDLGDGLSELLPRLPDGDSPLDCSEAGAYQGPPAPPGGVVISSATPAWLIFAGRVLEPVANQLLDIQPLNAMYFAGRGLGGRGNSFSDFAPVDPGDTETGQTLTLTIAQNVGTHSVSGQVSVGEFFISSFNCTSTTSPCIIGGIQTDARVDLTATFEEGETGEIIWGDACELPGDGFDCRIEMTEDLAVSVFFEVPQ